MIPRGLIDLAGSSFSRIELSNGENVVMIRPFRRAFFCRIRLPMGAPLAQPEVLHQRADALSMG